MKGTLWRLTLVLGLHVIALFAVMQAQPDFKRAISPVIVSLITAPQPLPQEPTPRPAPRKPAAAPAKPVAPRSLVVTPERKAPAPAAPESETPSPPAAITLEPNLTSPTPPSAPVAAAPPIEASAPIAVIAPRFDAAYLQNPAPAYPVASRRNREHGKVLLRVYVSAAGSAERVELGTSSGYRLLDLAAKDAVEKWRFLPARQAGQPVGAWVIVPIVFNLEG
ncbi:MAG: periplasmic protein TonB [Betaproteobacteria bacterium]